MSERPRFVFDANVIVSALLIEHSTPGRALYSALSHGAVLISRETIEELNDLLSRPKFDRYLPRDERELFLQGFVRDAALVEVVTQVNACRDPDDNKYLALALDGCATCIVSGDEQLLTLRTFEKIPILSPAQFEGFLAELRGQRSP